MKILLATEIDGHPFWQRNKYDFTLIDTDTEVARKLKFFPWFDKINNNWIYGEVEYYIRKDGIYARFFHCSSGSGKTPNGDAFLILAHDDYDKVIIIPSEEKRKAEQRYNGNWQDNSDFE